MPRRAVRGSTGDTKRQHRIIVKHFADPLTIAKLIHPLRRLDQIFAFFECVVTDVDPQMRPGKAGWRARAPAHVAPGNEIAFVVITKDVQDDILGVVLARCRRRRTTGTEALPAPVKVCRQTRVVAMRE